jgi:DNA mismatch endonuclease, patch repair protein
MAKKPKPYSEPKISVPRFSEAEGFYTTPQRSFNMSRIKGKNTKPELLSKLGKLSRN